MLPLVTDPGAAADLGVLLELVARGDARAAAAVYDATIDDAWRIAFATLGCPDRATAALEAAYQQVWSESRTAPPPAPARAESSWPRRLTRGWVLAWVYRASRDAAAAAA